MMLAFFAALGTAAAGQSVESVTIVEAECYVMESRDGQVVSTRLPGLRIIEATAREGPLILDVPEGAAIACPRSSIVPAPNDWEVLMAGRPLYIMETHVAPAERRVGALEVSQGQVRYRLVRGQFNPGEEEQVRARLNQMQERGRP